MIAAHRWLAIIEKPDNMISVARLLPTPLLITAMLSISAYASQQVEGKNIDAKNIESKSIESIIVTGRRDSQSVNNLIGAVS